MIPVELLEFDLSDRIRKALKISGYGTGAVAEALEVNPGSVSNWLAGRNAPRERELRAIARLTGVPLVWLKTGVAPDLEPGAMLYAPRDSNPEPAD